MNRPLLHGRRPLSQGPGSRCRGFSLLEVLVVLLVLSFSAAVAAPALGRFMEGLAFRKSVQRIVACVQYARLMAITKGKDVTLALGEEGMQLQMSGPVTEVRDLEPAPGGTLVMTPESFVFYADGGATPGALTYTQGERMTRIHLDPLTGIPRMD